jgi:tRNA 2-thiouridine synthesizing protein A
MNFDHELDARGLTCPLPILRTKRSLAGMTSGQVLKIISTDRSAVKDMQAFAAQTGNALLSGLEENGEFIFFMQKK